MATQPNKITPSQKAFVTATVTTSTDGLSDVIDLGGLSVCSIQNSTVGWTAAGLTFKGSAKSSDQLGSIYVTTAGTELTYTTSASYTTILDPATFAGIRFLQLRSGTAATPVAQAAARSIVIGLAPAGSHK